MRLSEHKGKISCEEKRNWEVMWLGTPVRDEIELLASVAYLADDILEATPAGLPPPLGPTGAHRFTPGEDVQA